MSKPKGVRKSKQVQEEVQLDMSQCTVVELRQMYNQMQSVISEDIDYAKLIGSAIIQQLIPMDEEDARILLSEAALSYAMLSAQLQEEDASQFCDMALEALDGLQGQEVFLLRVQTAMAKCQMALNNSEILESYGQAEPLYRSFIEQYDRAIEIEDLVQDYVVPVIGFIKQAAQDRMLIDEVYHLTQKLISKAKQTDKLATVSISMRLERALNLEHQDYGEFQEMYNIANQHCTYPQMKPLLLDILGVLMHLISAEEADAITQLVTEYTLLLDELKDQLETDQLHGYQYILQELA